MRTQKEILERFNQRRKTDMLGFEVYEYLYYLDYKYAKPFLKKEVTEEDWKHKKIPPAEKIKDYMPFAWKKANDCRGISAARSILHMLAWLWLDGKDEFLEKNDIENYEYYGKPQLIAICELYGIDWKKYDDGVRTNTG